MTVQLFRPARQWHRRTPQGKDEGIPTDRRPVGKFGRQRGAVACAANASDFAEYADQLSMRLRLALRAQQQVLKVVAV